MVSAASGGGRRRGRRRDGRRGGNLNGSPRRLPRPLLPPCSSGQGKDVSLLCRRRPQSPPGREEEAGEKLEHVYKVARRF